MRLCTWLDQSAQWRFVWMRHDTLRKTSSGRPGPPAFPGHAAVIIPLLLLLVLRPAGTLQSLNCTTKTINILTPGRGESLLLVDQTDTHQHCWTVPCRESRQPRNRHSLSSRPKSVLARMLAQAAQGNIDISKRPGFTDRFHCRAPSSAKEYVNVVHNTCTGRRNPFGALYC